MLLESWERLRWPGSYRVPLGLRARPGDPCCRLLAQSASYIVEADSTDNAARAVKAAGGQVVSRLGVIDAVEASLTSSQHQAVLAIQGVKQITPNSPVTTLAAASVRDNFEIGSFANNNGSHRWFGDWVEQNDNNSPYNGKVSIGWLERGGNRLIIGSNGAIYRRAATPSNASSVTLKLNYLRASLEAGEYVAVQASANGGTTWTEVGRISGAGNDTGFTAKSFNITAYRGRNTAIRFVSSMSEAFPGDYVDLDDVEIAYNTTYGEGDPLPVDVNTSSSMPMASAAVKSASRSSTPATGKSIRSTWIRTGSAAWPCSTTPSPTPWSATGRRSPPTPPVTART